MVSKVTDTSFDDDVLKASGTVVVDFWAEWCGPCRAIEPILEQIATEHAGKITVLKLNVDENPQSAMKYHITSIPAIKVFQNGADVQTIIGAKPKQALEADLAAYL